MTLIMWAEFVAMILVTVVLAYIAACVDIGRIERAARKQSEQNRIVEVLKRSE